MSTFDFHDADGIDSGARAFESRPSLYVSPERGLFCTCGSDDVHRNEDSSVTCAVCNAHAADPEYAASHGYHI